MRTRFTRTRTLVAGCAALVGLAGIVLPQAGALAVGEDAVTVTVDRAKLIRLPERTQTVIVGNPIIADVTLQKNGILVVTGKSYGVTNLIALDNAGTMLAESLIRVQAPSESLVTVQRGLERESYSCTPNCQPSILLGDSNKYFSEVGGQAGQRNTLATQR
jgi:Flp pilus assembly secretin CpaC